MKNILLISLIIGIILSMSYTAFSAELPNDKATMSKFIFGDKEELYSLSIYDIKQKHHSWQLSKEDAENILIFSKNVVLVPTANKEEIKDEDRYLKIEVHNDAWINIFISYDGYVTAYYAYTEEMIGAKYKIENLDYFKNNIDKLLSTQSNAYSVASPAKNQLTEISDWAQEYYDSAQEKDLLAPCVLFGFLKDNITREQFSDILFKLLEKTTKLEWSEDDQNPFEDTINKNVIALYNKNIIKGKSEVNFSPNVFITREEAATLLDRVIEYTKIKSNVKNSKFYADDAEISDWARDAAYNMLSLGIMKGIGENFLPKGSYTKEQAITTIVRIFNILYIEEIQSK